MCVTSLSEESERCVYSSVFQHENPTCSVFFSEYRIHYFNEFDFLHISIFTFKSLFSIKSKSNSFDLQNLFFIFNIREKTKSNFFFLITIQFIFSHHFKTTFYYRLSSNQIESFSF